MRSCREDGLSEADKYMRDELMKDKMRLPAIVNWLKVCCAFVLVHSCTCLDGLRSATATGLFCSPKSHARFMSTMPGVSHNLRSDGLHH